jgi:hypothetical protein
VVEPSKYYHGSSLDICCGDDSYKDDDVDGNDDNEDGSDDCDIIDGDNNSDGGAHGPDNDPATDPFPSIDEEEREADEVPISHDSECQYGEWV